MENLKTISYKKCNICYISYNNKRKHNLQKYHIIKLNKKIENFKIKLEKICQDIHDRSSKNFIWCNICDKDIEYNGLCNNLSIPGLNFIRHTKTSPHLLNLQKLIKKTNWNLKDFEVSQSFKNIESKYSQVNKENSKTTILKWKNCQQISTRNIPRNLKDNQFINLRPYKRDIY